MQEQLVQGQGLLDAGQQGPHPLQHHVLTLHVEQQIVALGLLQTSSSISSNSMPPVGGWCLFSSCCKHTAHSKALLRLLMTSCCLFIVLMLICMLRVCAHLADGLQHRNTQVECG